jgi:hypothetical protein
MSVIALNGGEHKAVAETETRLAIGTVTEPSEPEPESDFDWSDPDNLMLVEQPATACYVNRENSLVIRQRRWPVEDAFVIITAPNVHDFIDKLTDLFVPSVGKKRR